MLLCPEICVCMQSTLWGQTSILTKVARKVHSFKIPWTEQHLETAKVANNDSSSLEIQEKKKKKIPNKMCQFLFHNSRRLQVMDIFAAIMF